MHKRSLLAVAIAIDGVLAAAVTNNAVGKAASKKWNSSAAPAQFARTKQTDYARGLPCVGFGCLAARSREDRVKFCQILRFELQIKCSH